MAVDCTTAGALVERHAVGGLEVNQWRVLEEHCVGCAACRALALAALPVRDRPDPAATEAHVAARLAHPGVLVTPAEESCDPTWPGRGLADLVAESDSLADRLMLLHQVVGAVAVVAAAHEAGIVHRTLAPPMIRLGPKGEAYVSGWGLARDARRRDLSPFATWVGAPPYVAPEQVRGAVGDARSDVYSLGAILYFVLAGAPPYRDPSPVRLLERIARGAPPPPLAALVPDLRRDLAALVERAMAPEPAARHPSARELGRDLRARLSDGHVAWDVTTLPPPRGGER